jgi:hypothetical protein
VQRIIAARQVQFLGLAVDAEHSAGMRRRLSVISRDFTQSMSTSRQEVGDAR